MECKISTSTTADYPSDYSISMLLEDRCLKIHEFSHVHILVLSSTAAAESEYKTELINGTLNQYSLCMCSSVNFG